MFAALIPAVAGLLGTVIDKAFTDKDEAAKLKAKLTSQLYELSAQEMESATKIILAEAKGESWLQRNWRPLLMVTIIAIVANNYLFAPYAQLLGAPGMKLALPAELWDLMSIGVGGYIVGRSGEKITKAYKGVQ